MSPLPHAAPYMEKHLYLDRKQKVELQGRLSTVTTSSKGIAQGTVLRPILFIFYINDMFKYTKYVNLSLFADNCVVYLSGNNWEWFIGKYKEILML